MNDLPDDPSNWPTDPFKLLGLTQSATSKESRRAYFNLLRRYKPDQFPVEFQKINEAHSQVQALLQSGQQYASSAPSSPRAKVSPSPVTDRTSELDESIETAFWDFAEAEDWERVDRVLNGIPPEHQRHVWNFRLAEYYLRRCSADRNSLAEIHQRVALLCKLYLRPNQRHLIARELNSELENSPTAATSPALNEIVANASDEDGNFDLIQLRWKALNVVGAELIIDDMEILSTRQAHLMGSWYSLVAESLIYTIWNESKVSKRYTQKYRRVLDQDTNQLPANVSLLDLMFLARKEWRSAVEKKGMKDWFQAITHTYSFTELQLKELWLPIAERIHQEGATSLGILDQAFRTYPACMALFKLGLAGVLNRVSQGIPTEQPHDFQQQLHAFWNQNKKKKYIRARKPMLKFCCDNQILPILLSRFADQHLPSYATTTWSELLHKDGPFWCAYYASAITNSSMARLS